MSQAETRAVAEAAAVRERNEQRRDDFWRGPGETLYREQGERVRAARAQFRDAVAAADGAGTLSAYIRYCRVHAEAQAYTNAAASATLYQTQESGRMEQHIRLPARFHSHPESLGRMLEDATRALAKDQGSAYNADALAPLRESLEPEDD